MTDKGCDPRRTSFDQMADEANRAIGNAVNRLEKETEEFITYLNNEVVPAVRQHSSRGLRAASEKLKEFADYIDKQANQK